MARSMWCSASVRAASASGTSVCGETIVLTPGVSPAAARHTCRWESTRVTMGLRKARAVVRARTPLNRHSADHFVQGRHQLVGEQLHAVQPTRLVVPVVAHQRQDAERAGLFDELQ